MLLKNAIYFSLADREEIPLTQDGIRTLFVNYIWHDYIVELKLDDWKETIPDILDGDFYELGDNKNLSKADLKKIHTMLKAEFDWLGQEPMDKIKSIYHPNNNDMLPLINKKPFFTYSKDDAPTLPLTFTLDALLSTEIANIVGQGQWSRMGQSLFGGDSEPRLIGDYKVGDMPLSRRRGTSKRDKRNKLIEFSNGIDSIAVKADLFDFEDNGDSITFNDLKFKREVFGAMNIEPTSRVVVANVGSVEIENDFWFGEGEIDEEELLTQILKIKKIQDGFSGNEYTIKFSDDKMKDKSAENQITPTIPNSISFKNWLHENKYKMLPYSKGTKTGSDWSKFNAKVQSEKPTKLKFGNKEFNIVDRGEWEGEEDGEKIVIPYFELDNPFFVASEEADDDALTEKDIKTLTKKNITIGLNTKGGSDTKKTIVHIKQKMEYTPTQFTRPRGGGESGGSKVKESRITPENAITYFLPLTPKQKPDAITSGKSFFVNIIYHYKELKLAIDEFKKDIGGR